MLRELHWVGPGLTVASFAYALSPYLLHYGARISVILLPFAGLPWLIAIAARCVRRGGWRWPAAFALVTLTVGGVNATSLILVMAAPDPLDGTRRMREPGGAVAKGARRGAPDNAAHRNHLAVVDRRPGSPGRLRDSDTQIHRDLLHGCQCSAEHGAAERSGLLVLLRQGRTGSVDRPRRADGAELVGPGVELRGAAAVARVRLPDPIRQPRCTSRCSSPPALSSASELTHGNPPLRPVRPSRPGPKPIRVSHSVPLRERCH